LPDASVTAIVLQRTESGESDRRLTLLTREMGKIDVIARGARKGGSRLAGISEPLVFATMHLAIGRHRRFVTQAQPLTSYPKLRSDYDVLTCGLAIAELACTHLPYEAPVPEVFEAVAKGLSALCDEGRPLVPLVWFSARLMGDEGLMPDWAACAVTGSPLLHTPVWVAPSAGGAVGEESADGLTDRMRVSAEALIGIERISRLSEPPPKLKRAEESALVLHRFWQGVLDAPLPAGETVMRAIASQSE